MQVFGHDVQLVSKSEVEPRDTREKKVPVVSWDYCFLRARNRIGEAELEQRGDSPVLVVHDGVTKSIFAHLIPKLREGGEDDSQTSGQFWIQQSGISVRQ